jgi:alkylation response protein AidB-like acyl-CoA dehydrogenase
MRRMKTTGSSASGTTFIELDDVKVPVENLIGQVRFDAIILAFGCWRPPMGSLC